MSAEILRRAAALMRERAEWATPGPWEAFRRHDGALAAPDHIGVVAGEGGDVRADVFEDQRCAAEDADHIASWHPDVALAVADWLEFSAITIDGLDAAGSKTVVAPGAFAVARAYLGGDA